MFCVSVCHSNIVCFFTGKLQFGLLSEVCHDNERCVSNVYERERERERERFREFVVFCFLRDLCVFFALHLLLVS